MKPEKIAPLFFVMAGLVVIGIGWFSRASLPISRATGRVLGITVFVLGMIAFTWATAHLKKAFLGDVAPVTEIMITSGPFRWVRHPLYLSMIATLIGISLALRSLWGIIAVPVLFLPAVIYRARLEEQFLGIKFGSEWEIYASRTSFLIPWLW